MASHKAFFYGTLMAPPVLHRVIWGQSSPPTPAHASLLTIRPAILHAHQRHKVRGADYPAIVPASAATSVRGTLVEGLTDGDIWRLDIFEGEDYSRRKVGVRVLRQAGELGDVKQPASANVEGEEEVTAETYIWTASTKYLETEEWDFAEFVRDKMRRWVGREAAETDEGFQGRPSINGTWVPAFQVWGCADEWTDVDDAVAAQEGGNDPTGGRGANGSITRQLDKDEETRREALEGAV